MRTVMRRAFLACLLASLAVPVLASPANAHASLVSSEPADGAALAASPSLVSLTFTEPPDLSLSSIQVLSPRGARMDRATPVPRGNGSIVELSLPDLPKGAYTVAWRVVSKVDGHLTAGAFAFGVGEEPGAPTVVQTVESPTPGPMAVAGRVLLYAGLALLVGAAFAGLVVFGGPLPSWRWALPSAFLASWAGFGMMVFSQANRSDTGLSAFLSSARGGRLIREGIALAVLAVAAIVASRVQKRWASGALLGAASIAIVAHAATGHAGVAPRPTATHSFHMLAVAAWIGGVVWLIAGLARTPPRERGGPAGRFARLAGVALALVAVTGTVRAFDEIGRFKDLTGTSFGTSVLVKIALFLPLLALGAVNHYRSVPRLRKDPSTSRLARLVAVEVALASGIFATTGVLTELPPSKSLAAAGAQQPPAVVVSGNDFATTVRLTLRIEPGRPGRNRIVAKVVDFDSREPVAATAVQLRVTLPSNADVGTAVVDMAKEGDTWVATSSAFSLSGKWRIVAEITKPESSATVTLDADVRSPPPVVQVSKVPGQPTLYTLDLEGIGSIQVYADPGTPGSNQVHATFFNLQGRELRVGRPKMAIVGPDGTVLPSKLNVLGPGHFVADVDIAATGVYQVQVSGRDGTRQLSLKIDFEIETGES